MPNNDQVTRTFTAAETERWFAGLEKRFASADVLCETADGKLLIERSPYKAIWAIPGGIIDAGETPKVAALREVAEEVGIALEPSTVEFVGVSDRILGELGHAYLFVFRASISQTQLDTIVLQTNEVEEVAFVSREEVLTAGMRDGRPFGSSIIDWAHGVTGYSEKVLPSR